jgi:hypothetical protein
MQVNAKDIAAGVFLILVALFGLYINGGFFGLGLEQHNLGSARRMGPGYMPMLVFWLLLILSSTVLLLGLFNGPDPLAKWTQVETASFVLALAVGLLVWWLSPLLGPYFTQTYNGLGLGMLAGFLTLCFAQGWRLIGYICAAMCVFALLLEKGGLMLALVGTILVSTMAEPDHRAKPLGVLGVMIFLLALCWWVFIKQLDIRVQVFPWS